MNYDPYIMESQSSSSESKKINKSRKLIQTKNNYNNIPKDENKHIIDVDSLDPNIHLRDIEVYHHNYINHLSPQQKQILEYYSGSGFQLMNTYLRDGIQLNTIDKYITVIRSKSFNIGLQLYIDQIKHRPSHRHLREFLILKFPTMASDDIKLFKKICIEEMDEITPKIRINYISGATKHLCKQLSEIILGVDNKQFKTSSFSVYRGMKQNRFRSGEFTEAGFLSTSTDPLMTLENFTTGSFYHIMVKTSYKYLFYGGPEMEILFLPHTVMRLKQSGIIDTHNYIQVEMIDDGKST